MLKILIAVDGSEHTKRTIEAVAKMAHATVSLEASLINVRAGAILDPLFANDYSMITVQKLDAEQEAAQASVLEAATKLAKEQGIPLSEPIRAYGNVAHAIVKAAQELQADLIVMGTRGEGTLSRVLLGSVAQKVLHDAMVPVVLVK
ncbi:MAG: universal stress protein [Rhodoferax sp.]|nr:universal stress protein [Rhodoferax sp.]